MADDDLESPDDYIDLEDPDEPTEETITYDEEALNLVADFEATAEGREELKRIAEYVVKTFETDWEASSELRERVAKDMKLFSGDLPKKDFPFENSANANVPIMLKNLGLLQSRLMAEVFGDWTNVVGVMPTTTLSETEADIVARHINWQMRNVIIDFERQMDRAMMTFLVAGWYVIHSYWDRENDVPRQECLMPEEFVMPYAYVSTMPDCSDLPHHTWVRRMYRHTLDQHAGVWEHVDELLERAPDDWDEEPDAPQREAAGFVLGETPPADASDGAKLKSTSMTVGANTPYKILYHEGWMRLPNQDRDRWVQAIVHESSQLVLSLRIHEEPDHIDKERYEDELAEAQEYAARYLQHKQSAQQLQTYASALQSKPIVDGEDAAAITQATAALPEAPVPPAWMSDPDDIEERPRPVRSVPVRRYAKAVCIENLTGGYGLGMGRIEGDYQKAASTLLSQGIDAATAANAAIFLLHESLEIEGGKSRLDIRPGAMNKVGGLSPQEMKEAVMELKPTGANPQVFEAMQAIMRFSEDAVQASDVLSGAPGKSGETAHGHAARLEQAVKQLGIFARRFSSGLLQVYRNQAKLNALYLDSRELVAIARDKLEEVDPATVTRRLYERDFRIELVSNLKFSSEQQRIAEADQMVTLGNTIPALAQNPAYLYAAIKMALEARDRSDLVRTLGQAPPAPPVFGMPPQGAGQSPGPGGPPLQGQNGPQSP